MQKTSDNKVMVSVSFSFKEATELKALADRNGLSIENYLELALEEECLKHMLSEKINSTAH